MGQIYVPTILQILIDFFEGCFLWKFYGEFLERRFQEKQKWEFGIMVLYVLFQNGKKLLLPMRRTNIASAAISSTTKRYL